MLYICCRVYLYTNVIFHLIDERVYTLCYSSRKGKIIYVCLWNILSHTHTHETIGDCIMRKNGINMSQANVTSYMHTNAVQYICVFFILYDTSLSLILITINLIVIFCVCYCFSCTLRHFLYHSFFIHQ